MRSRRGQKPPTAIAARPRLPPNYLKLLNIFLAKVLDNPLTLVYTLYVDSDKGYSMRLLPVIDAEGRAFLTGMVVGMGLGVCVMLISVALLM